MSESADLQLRTFLAVPGSKGRATQLTAVQEDTTGVHTMWPQNQLSVWFGRNAHFLEKVLTVWFISDQSSYSVWARVSDREDGWSRRS